MTEFELNLAVELPSWASGDDIARIARVVADEVLKEGSFSINFISEEEMRGLNRDWRGIDDATDILTFAQVDGEDFPAFPGEEGGDEKEWGDIFINIDRLERNAEDFGVPREEELRRLIVHGVLHLSGLDHETNDFASEPMLVEQEALLKRLGLV